MNMKKIKRADIERILILCAAALVVVLALKGNDQTTSQVLVEQTSIPIEQTMTDAQVETVSTVVFMRTARAIWCRLPVRLKRQTESPRPR